MKNKIITIEQMPYHYEDIKNLEYTLAYEDEDEREYYSKMNVLLFYKQKKFNKIFATVGRFTKLIELWDEENEIEIENPEDHPIFGFRSVSNENNANHLRLSTYTDTELGFISLDSLVEYEGTIWPGNPDDIVFFEFL